MKAHFERRNPAPTLHSAFRAVERYWDMVRSDGGARGTPPLLPVDAMLLHLLLDLLPDRSLVVDLAAGPTQGTSSVVVLSHGRVRRVILGGPACRPDERSWRAHLDRFRREAELDVPLEGLPGNLPGKDACAAVAGLAREAGVVVLLACRPGEGEQLTGRVDACLQANPQAVVLVLGLGRVGESDAIAALLAARGERPVYRLQLLRERGAVLAASTLGLLTHAEHPAQEALARIEHLYVSNLDLLDLLKQRNLQAIRAAGSDGAALPSHPVVRNLEQQVAQLQAELKQARTEAEEKAAQEVLPPPPLVAKGRVRQRILRLGTRALEVYCCEGVLPFCKMAARKVLRKARRG